MSVPGATIRAMTGDLEPLPARVLSAAPGAGPRRDDLADQRGLGELELHGEVGRGEGEARIEAVSDRITAISR